MFVKICGLKTLDNVDHAVELDYSAMGVVLHAGSPRYCDASHARTLARRGKGRIITVAVGLTFDEVRDVYDYFDFVQIYEESKRGRVIYAGTSIPKGEYPYFLYDASRGSGDFSELPSWIGDVQDRLIISGGLHSGNVAGIIKQHRPFGIDVSSGVEKERGIKDITKMKEFINEVRNGVY